MSDDHFTDAPPRRVGALGLVLGAWRNGVLLVERERCEGPARWGLPGGRAAAGEDVRAACRRGIREETGLSVVTDALLAVHHVPAGARADAADAAAGADEPSAEGFTFVLACGRVDEGSQVRLGAGLASYAFVRPADLDTVVSPYASERIRHALVQRSRLTTDAQSVYLPG